ncbi:MAG: EAL domain-containing protein [Alphaproteobacteria bacterium]|nr:EAL domain-containing protein [Alphaproteobacteria bacterium]
MLRESVYREEYQPGSSIFREGEPGNCAYVIERGAVVLETLRRGRRITIASLGEGELFGEMALMDGEVRTSSAVATEETVLVVISLDQLREKFEQADPLLTFFTRNILERFRATQSRLLSEETEGGDAEPADVPVFDTGLSLNRHRERALRTLKLEGEMNQALVRNEFALHFQPILDLRTGNTAGVEALLRWNHPERGLLYPQDFIAFAEESGLIVPIGFWVLEEACRALHGFQNRLHAVNEAAPPLFMAFNLSSRQFSDIDLVRNISNIVDTTGVNPEQIKLEITESLLMDNPARAAVTLNGVKAIGLEVAIDDFGTGYSSLSYLHRFRIDTLKIDRSFVSTATMNPGSMEVVRAVAGLARNLGLDIVAEGLEEPEQVTLLRDLQCDYGQGYFFSRPVEAEEILARLAAENRGTETSDVDAGPAKTKPARD